MSRKVNIACIQTRAFAQAEEALAHAIELCEQALANNAINGANNDAQLLLLPEYAGGLTTEGRLFAPPVYSEESHPVLMGLCDFARSNNVWIVLGSVAIKPTNASGNHNKFINRSFVIDNQGEVQARYDKIHLFDISLSETQSYRESEKVQSGNQAVVIDTPIGKLGMSICYDLRFPSLYRDLAQAGAEILLVPAAFTKKTGEAHWHILNRARAIENGAFVIAPCATGSVSGGGESFGHSLIIDPWGTVLAEGDEQVGVVHAVIDLDDVARTRDKIPSLTHGKTYTLNTPEQQNAHKNEDVA